MVALLGIANGRCADRNAPIARRGMRRLFVNMRTLVGNGRSPWLIAKQRVFDYTPCLHCVLGIAVSAGSCVVSSFAATESERSAQMYIFAIQHTWIDLATHFKGSK